MLPWKQKIRANLLRMDGVIYLHGVVWVRSIWSMEDSGLPATKPRERKHVLLLAESPYLGGITSHLLSILDGRGSTTNTDFTLATLPGRREDVSLLEGAASRGVEIVTLPMSGTFDFRVLGAIRRLVQERAIDLIHTHNYRATVIAHAARCGVPLVTTCHGVIVQPTMRLRVWQALEHHCVRTHPVTVACSDYVRGWLGRNGIDRERIMTVRNGYRAPSNDVHPASRALIGISPESIAVLYAGRVVAGKGLEHVIDVLGEFPDFCLLVLGDGPLVSEFKKRSQERKANVHFLGAIARPEAYYVAADIVVLASEMEALPMSLIEAAAFGKPVVATRVGGIPEIVVDGKTGLLLESHERSAIRDAFAALRDAGYRARLGHAAKQRHAEQFTVERMVGELDAVYDRVLDRRA